MNLMLLDVFICKKGSDCLFQFVIHCLVEPIKIWGYVQEIMQMYLYCKLIHHTFRLVLNSTPVLIHNFYNHC